MNIGYIICETATTYVDKINIIEESTGSSRRLIAEGVLQTANEKNRNGRWYDADELFPQIEAPRTLELLNAGYLRAECGHPLSKDLARQQTIDAKLCCAQFLKLWRDGMNVMGTFKGTNNALGEEFDMDLRDGCLPAWSLRALGSVEETSRGIEVKNPKIITYDNVIYPSHPGAYTRRIVSESTEELVEGGYTRKRPDHVLTESAGGTTFVDNGKGLLIPINNQSVIDYIKSESCNFYKIKESFDVLYETITPIDNFTKVQLVDKAGSTIIINLEDYIHNEIMDYCSRR